MSCPKSRLLRSVLGRAEGRRWDTAISRRRLFELLLAHLPSLAVSQPPARRGRRDCPEGVQAAQGRPGCPQEPRFLEGHGGVRGRARCAHQLAARIDALPPAVHPSSREWHCQGCCCTQPTTTLPPPPCRVPLPQPPLRDQAQAAWRAPSAPCRSALLIAGRTRAFGRSSTTCSREPRPARAPRWLSLRQWTFSAPMVGRKRVLGRAPPQPPPRAVAPELAPVPGPALARTGAASSAGHSRRLALQQPTEGSVMGRHRVAQRDRRARQRLSPGGSEEPSASARAPMRTSRRGQPLEKPTQPKPQVPPQPLAPLAPPQPPQ